MSNTDFVAKAEAIVKTKTVYMWGTFGRKYVTDALINYKKKQYPKWYTMSKVTQLKRLVGKKVTPWDCVGLIKGILWTDSKGDIQYESNGVPDTNADGFIKLCYDVSTSFNNITVGEVVWMSGHIGIYAGNGKVVEATPAWKDGVQITNLSQRNWKKHGKVPYISYDGKKGETTLSKLTITGRLDRPTVLALQKHYNMPKGYNDGMISRPSALVMTMQADMGMQEVDGYLGKDTKSEIQRRMGTPVDGVFSRYSTCVAEMQRQLNNKSFSLNGGKTPHKPVLKVPEKDSKLRVTGSWDKQTITRLQEYLGMQYIDGVLSKPYSSTIAEIQKRLNNNQL